MNAPHSTLRLRRNPDGAARSHSRLTEAFNADKNPKKVNLGVGVYYDDDGKVPLLECVLRAERLLVEQAAPRNYLPIDASPRTTARCANSCSERTRPPSGKDVW